MYAHVPSEGEASEEGTCAISDFGPSADRECGLRTADGASEEGGSECGLRVRTADCERGVRGRVRRNADCECGLRTANGVSEAEFAGMRTASPAYRP